MLGPFVEREANKNNKYYKVIHTMKKYENERRFPINEVVIADKKIDISENDRSKLGGLYISTYDFIFRWLIRGDTICEVIIPDDSKIYKTTSDNGIYLSEKIILKNPKKIDDKLAMELYKASKLPEISYFKAMTACCIMGYINTALKVFEEKVNENNIKIAISEFEDFCKRREEEHYIKNSNEDKNVKLLYQKLNKLKEKQLKG